MSITITGNTDSVTLNDPQGLVKTIGKRIQNFIFPDGTDEQADYGKTNDQITITGVETNDAENKMNTLNNIMNNGETIQVTGFSDSSLNTYYHIVSLQFKKESGEIERYSYTLTLEKKYEEA